MSIKGHEKETKGLNSQEIELIPDMIAFLSRAIGSSKAVNNYQIASFIQSLTGVQIKSYRIRKMIQHIQLNGLINLLCASSKGYYIAQTEKEAVDYCVSLSQRITTQTMKRNAMRDQVNEAKKEGRWEA
jgi:hypothetical protein